MKDMLYKHAFSLISMIEKAGYQARIVGGAVRDYVLESKNINDVDIATTMLPNDVIDLLSQRYGIKCLPTGIAYGTIMAIYKGHPYEITTLRKDVRTDGRRAVVEFSDSWYEDSIRRDFTFNAMYMDRNMNIYDFHNGRDDLISKRIQFIGDAETRIREDYLRILRYYRFLFRYAPDYNDALTEEALKTNAIGLDRVSGERILDELLKIFAIDGLFKNMRRISWLLNILLQQECKIFSSNESAFLKLNADDRFSAFLAINGEQCVDAAINNLKLPNRLRKKCAALLNMIHSDDFSYTLLNYPPDTREWLKFPLILCGIDEIRYDETIGRIKHEFDIRGRDLLDIVPEQSEISMIMKRLKSLWCKSGGTLSKHELLAALFDNTIEQ